MGPRARFAAILRTAIPLAMLAFASCGKQGFVPGVNAQKQVSPGYFEIPAKVDILLAEDDTGSIVQVFSSLQSQMPGFLDTLQGSGWDYRFAVTPLTTPRSIDQVIGSRYDGNWDALGGWLSPFPGARPQDNMLPSYLFRTPNNFSAFLTGHEINSNYGPMADPGFNNIISQLQASSSWLRSDAYLLILAITNGEDGSDVNQCYRMDGGGIEPCSPGIGWPGNQCKKYPEGYFASCSILDNRSATWTAKRNQITALKSSHELIRFNSMVAYTRGAGCQGQYSYRGDRYIQMSQDFAGMTGIAVNADICSTSVSSMLAQTTQQLTATRLNMRQRYLVIEREPRVETIHVFKNGQELPQDSLNGWTYAGFGNAYLIDYPVQANYVTGKYLIELHGSAKLLGADDGRVEYERL